MLPRVVFMGSPEFALPTLSSLAQSYSVVGVVTQPDRPAGRGQSLTPPPVKSLALALNIPMIQPNKLREPAAWEQLQAWQPDLIIVVAFGQILRQNVLDLPRLGCINVHASLLPRWRGASPIVASILNGDAETGVTIMQMDAGVDSGGILAQQATPILFDDTTPRLSERLAQIGADLLLQTLPGYLNGSILPRPQDEAQVTKAPMIAKENGLLDPALPAATLARRVRAFKPWPGSYILLDGAVFKIHQAHPINQVAHPGQLAAINGFPALGTVEGWLVLDEVQPAGKKAMPGDVFLRGARGWKLGTDS